MNNLIWFFGQIIKDVFRLALITLVVFFALEAFEPGLISNHFNFNLLLVFCLVFGVLTAFWPSAEAKVKGVYFWGFVFGLLIVMVIGWQTYNQDLFGYILPLLAGLIIVLIFWAMRD